MESNSFRLEILEGLHHGVELALDKGEYSFGQDTACDIVLGDDGVVKRHAVLQLTKDGASIEAVGGTLFVDGVEIAVGHGCRLRTPAKLTIGGAGISLTGSPGQQHRLDGRLRGAIRLFSEHPITVCSGFIVSAMTVSFIFQGVLTQRLKVAKPPVVQSTLDEGPDAVENEAAAIMAVEQKSLTVSDAYQALKKKLSDVGIQTVRLVMDDQVIAAKGRVSEEKAKDWVSIQRWYDRNYSSAALLNVNVDIGAIQGPVPVRLQAIWFGERPYIIPENGIRYYEGAILESGWVVERITEHRVLLTKNGETFTLTYQ